MKKQIFLLLTITLPLWSSESVDIKDNKKPEVTTLVSSSSTNSFVRTGSGVGDESSVPPSRMIRRFTDNSWYIDTYLGMPDPFLNLRFDGIPRPDSNHAIAHAFHLANGRPFIVVGTQHDLPLGHFMARTEALGLTGIAGIVLTEVNAPPLCKEIDYLEETPLSDAENERRFSPLIVGQHTVDKYIADLTNPEKSRPLSTEYARDYIERNTLLSLDGRWYEKAQIPLSSTIFDALSEHTRLPRKFFENNEFHPYAISHILYHLKLFTLYDNSSKAPYFTLDFAPDDVLRKLAQRQGKGVFSLETRSDRDDTERKTLESHQNKILSDIITSCQEDSKSLWFFPTLVAHVKKEISELEVVLAEEEEVPSTAPRVVPRGMYNEIRNTRTLLAEQLCALSQPVTRSITDVSDIARGDVSDIDRADVSDIDRSDPVIVDAVARDDLWAERIQMSLCTTNHSPVVCVVGQFHTFDLVRALAERGAIHPDSAFHPITSVTLPGVIETLELHQAGLTRFVEETHAWVLPRAPHSVVGSDSMGEAGGIPHDHL
ncbi:MAG: hypothetical protein H6849_02590 [Alphaproteobacteria bacterium]|nr:MAG: hypothetical protein H6849_02590 [Alphaproteobacteria bacterium]